VFPQRLYLDQQAIDTTTPAGKLMFQVTGAFAEFEAQHDPPEHQCRTEAGRTSGLAGRRSLSSGY